MLEIMLKKILKIIRQMPKICYNKYISNRRKILMKKFKIKTRPSEEIMMAINDELDDKLISENMKKMLEEAYKIFTHDLNGKLTVCTPCCVSEENVEKLIKTPVRELSRELMWEYLDAVNLDETGLEIKHFLPKILEFIVKHAEIRLDTSLILDKCHFEKKIWNNEELDFMYRFSNGFMFEVLKTDPKTARIENFSVYMTMFNLGGLKTEHLFDIEMWKKASEDINALWHFEEMMYSYTEGYTYYSYAFSSNSEFNEQMNLWMNSKEIAEIFLPVIEKYYFENPEMDYEEQWRLDQLYSVLEKNLKK